MSLVDMTSFNAHNILPDTVDVKSIFKDALQFIHHEPDPHVQNYAFIEAIAIRVPNYIVEWAGVLFSTTIGECALHTSLAPGGNTVLKDDFIPLLSRRHSGYTKSDTEMMRLVDTPSMIAKNESLGKTMLTIGRKIPLVSL